MFDEDDLIDYEAQKEEKEAAKAEEKAKAEAKKALEANAASTLKEEADKSGTDMVHSLIDSAVPAN
jgi:hypothetical protein